MGMSASQARMLTLTSRLSDLEYRMQNIANSKLRLADQTNQISTDYSDALNKQKFTVLNTYTNTYEDATLNKLLEPGNVGVNRIIRDSRGRLIIPKEWRASFDSPSPVGIKNKGYDDAVNHGGTDEDKAYWTAFHNLTLADEGIKFVFSDSFGANANNVDWLQAQVEAGNLTLETFNSTDKQFKRVSWTSGDKQLQEVIDDSKTAIAESNYNTAMNEIQSKEKRLDLEMQNIDTEHSATQTEIDSVRKVIEKNIDRTFKMFDA